MEYVEKARRVMEEVEKVIVDGETSHYRLVVGTTREAIDEYVKLKESPA